jgi:hypothetical protein
MPTVKRTLRNFMLACGFAATAAVAANWTEIATDADGNRYSIDHQSIVREGSTVKGVVRAEYASPRLDDASGKSFFAALDRMIVDCDAASFALQSRTYVAADGSEVPALASARQDLKLRPAAAGSLSETIVRSLCRAARGK